MNDDYLWDKSGPADSEISHLEKVLGELRWQSGKPRRRWPWRTLAIAAAVLIAVGLTLFLRRTQTAGPMTSWELWLANGKSSGVRSGEVIETSGTLKSEFIGEVRIEPESRLRLVAARAGLQQLALDHGTIHAFIWAPPTTFVVDTPAARTVDLGCQYTLNVARDGTGFLSVETGWVAFEWHGAESFIPAGAVCRTRRGHGPDTPYFEDAPVEFSKHVAQFDQTGNAFALRAALGEARSRDALTLWHLLRRTQGPVRVAVFKRFSRLVKLPGNVTADAILSGDRQAMDTAWNALDLGDMTWWREWKRPW